MLTREMIICKAMLDNPKVGISEKESYFKVHFLNARNEVGRIERIIGSRFNRQCETSQHDRRYTRYTPKDEKQIRKIAALFNEKLAYHQAKNRYLDELPIGESQIQNAVNRLAR